MIPIQARVLHPVPTNTLGATKKDARTGSMRSKHVVAHVYKWQDVCSQAMAAYNLAIKHRDLRNLVAITSAVQSGVVHFHDCMLVKFRVHLV